VKNVTPKKQASHARWLRKSFIMASDQARCIGALIAILCAAALVFNRDNKKAADVTAALIFDHLV